MDPTNKTAQAADGADWSMFAAGERLRDGFHRIAGVKAPSGVDALEVAYSFASAAPKGTGQALVRFGILNGEGQLAVVCGVRGLVHASEFSALAARMGYERKSARSTEGGGFDFLYAPGLVEDPTITRNLLA